MNQGKNSKIVLLLSVLIIKVLRKVSQIFKGHIYFGQTGEDIILKNLFRNTKTIFYVDVGCNHPISLSNTFNFYLNGGHGICIDANKQLTRVFQQVRKRDIVVHSLVSMQEKEMTFYSLENHAMSTADPDSLPTHEDARKVRKEKIKSRSLNSILEEHLPKNQKIDLLSVDVEGLDFEVLSSINLEYYKPAAIVVEIHKLDISAPDFLNNKIIKLLSDNNYKIKYYSTMNAYFVRNNNP